MKNTLVVILLLTVFACSKNTYPKPAPEQETTLFEGQELPTDAVLTTIALGSCNRQDLPQDMWPYIQENNPQLWIWLGDNIYGDSEDMAVLERKYRQQKFAHAYTNFRREVPVIGTWDDHDFGVNDGGKEYSKKVESKELMLDFLDVPKNAAVRSREGAYQSYTFGPKGKQIKVLLLDARYFRDTLKRNSSGGMRYVVNETGDVLGEAQWEWLEQELRNSTAQIHLIGSGIQMIPEEQFFEKWANFPAARKRLFGLLQEVKPAHTILMSGDRHIAELSKIELDDLPYPLYELTSSGLTHSYEAVDEENRYRVGPVCGKLNFGLLKIDWATEVPSVKVWVKGIENTIYLEEKLSW